MYHYGIVASADLDLAILSFVADKPSSTVTDAAKALFEPDDVDELRKRDTMLRHHYKNLCYKDLLSSKKSGNRTTYSINKSRVIFCHGVQSMVLGGKKFHATGLDDEYCLVLLLGQTVEVHSLDALDKRW